MSFRDFIDQLQSDRLLLENHERLSPYLEVSRLVGRHEGPVLFSNVNGHKVVFNIIASRHLMARALGTSPDETVHYLAGIEPRGDVTCVHSTPAREVVENEVDLASVPVLTYFPGTEARISRQES